MHYISILSDSATSTNMDECLHKCHLYNNQNFFGYQIDSSNIIGKSNKKWSHYNSKHYFSISSPTSNGISRRTLVLNQHSENGCQTEGYSGIGGQQSFTGFNSGLIFLLPLEPERRFESESALQFGNTNKEKEKEKRIWNKQIQHYWNLITITHSFWNGTLTISGNGEMTDYSSLNSTRWSVTATSITKVIIKAPITSVGSYSFDSYYTKIESVEIANSVLKINQWAFYNCVSLTSLILPNSLTLIGEYAFSDCNALASLILPNNLSIIPDYCFGWCYALTSLIIPVGVTTLQTYAFYFCAHLESVNISHTVTIINNTVFANCFVLTCVYYDGTTDPGSSASLVFGSTKVEKVRVSANYGSGNTFCGYPIEIGVSCIINKINSKTFSPTIKSKLSSSLIMKMRRHYVFFLFQPIMNKEE